MALAEKIEIIEAQYCTTMKQVRMEIDRLDRDIVTLIAERTRYIEAAGRIKQNRDVVHDDARINDVLKKTAHRALETGAPLSIVEQAYRALMAASIAHEFEVFDAAKALSPQGEKEKNLPNPMF
jgi:isochorismate pyruvate lyase